VELFDSHGEVVERVVRDDEGNVIRLVLRGMQLTQEDFAAIARITTLRSLVFYQTNLTDADLQQICHLPNLTGLNLCSTEITDAAIDEIIQFPALRSLCLGNVTVTPAAVARLKDYFEANNRDLALGYAQRK
jgi:uncharacterized protein YjbI with pentapeptide repeats